MKWNFRVASSLLDFVILKVELFIVRFCLFLSKLHESLNIKVTSLSSDRTPNLWIFIIVTSMNYSNLFYGILSLPERTMQTDMVRRETIKSSDGEDAAMFKVSMK